MLNETRGWRWANIIGLTVCLGLYAWHLDQGGEAAIPWRLAFIGGISWGGLQAMAMPGRHGLFKLGWTTAVALSWMATQPFIFIPMAATPRSIDSLLDLTQQFSNTQIALPSTMLMGMFTALTISAFFGFFAALTIGAFPALLLLKVENGSEAQAWWGAMGIGWVVGHFSGTLLVTLVVEITALVNPLIQFPYFIVHILLGVVCGLIMSVFSERLFHQKSVQKQEIQHLL